METIKTLLFEEPLPLYVVLGVLELAVLLWWRQRREKWGLVLVPLALAGVIFALDTAIVTPREQLTLDLHELAKQAAAHDADAIAEHLSDDFHGTFSNRQLATETLRSILKRYEIRSVAFTDLTIHVEGDRAQIQVTTIVDSASYGRTSVTWDLDWKYQNKLWKITAAHCRDMPEGIPAI